MRRYYKVKKMKKGGMVDKAVKALQKPRRQHNQRVAIMGPEEAWRQERDMVLNRDRLRGGYSAKETIKRVGEYKRAKAKKVAKK